MSAPVVGGAETTSSARRAAGDRPRRRRGTTNIEGCVFVVALILLWQVLVQTGVLAFDFLPAPSAVWTAAVEMARSGALFPPLQHTLTAAVLGWAIAAVIGLVGGLLLGTLPGMWRYTMGSIDVVRSIPAIVFVPIIALTFGISLRAEIIVIVYAAAWPTLINTLDGAQNVRAGLRDTATIMRMSRWAFLRKIVLPAAVPDILVGLRLSMGLALTLAVVGELLINPQGLGFSLLQSQQFLRPPTMFAIVCVIGILGFLLNALLLVAARLLLPRPLRGAAARREGEVT
jgi:ABC-type nitrate/sulfonate/bicarbonate transport system permease component